MGVFGLFLIRCLPILACFEWDFGGENNSGSLGWLWPRFQGGNAKIGFLRLKSGENKISIFWFSSLATKIQHQVRLYVKRPVEGSVA